MNHKPDRKAQQRGAQPAQSDAGERQITQHNLLDRFAAERMEHAFGQRGDEIIQRNDERQRRGADEHRAIVIEEFPDERKQDQRDRQRIQEHQHRYGIGDDGAEPEIGEQQRNNAENDRPRTVARPLREQAAEGFRAARDQTDGGFQTGERHRRRQYEQSRVAQIVLRDLRQRCKRKSAALADEKVKEAVGNKKVEKIIVIPKRLVNIIVK